MHALVCAVCGAPAEVGCANPTTCEFIAADRWEAAMAAAICDDCLGLTGCECNEESRDRDPLDLTASERRSEDGTAGVEPDGEDDNV